MPHILTGFKRIWCGSLRGKKKKNSQVKLCVFAVKLSAPSKHLSVISGPYDEILHQQFKSRTDFYFLLVNFFHSFMHIQAFNCISMNQRPPFRMKWWEKSLMHVRIYDVIQKGQAKFKQYRALFISAKVLSVFL